MEEAARQAIGRALGRVPSGLFLCSAGAGTDAVPFVASWVQQAAMQPPAVSVAIEANRRALAAMSAAGGAFTLSILPQGRDDLLKPFFRAFDQADPFRGVATLRTPGGGFYLADALAWLECREVTRALVGDHVVVIGEVVAGDVLRDGPPWIHLRRTGFSY